VTAGQRVQQQPAFLLHHRPFRDSSLLLDVLSRDHGRIALVARGARGAKSRVRGVLRPFLPLRLSWLLRSDLGTLTGAELERQPLALGGDSLLSGYYLNELLMNFLHRHDPQPEVYCAYSGAVHALAGTREPAPVLRAFELELLGLLGYGIHFEAGRSGEHALDPSAHYEYRVEQGAVRVQRSEGEMVFSGEELAGIRDQRFDEPAMLRAAGRLLRAVIAFHLGGRELKSRKVLLDLHRSRARMDERSQAGKT
jgi:DNA repair protein RecO (recombination protein O)